jgi:hypothetical protein
MSGKQIAQVEDVDVIDGTSRIDTSRIVHAGMIGTLKVKDDFRVDISPGEITSAQEL